MKKSIAKQFSITLLAAGIILFLSGSLLLWRIWVVQNTQAIELQTEVAKRAVNEFVIITHAIEERLAILTKTYNLPALPPDEQANILSRFRIHKDQRHNDPIDEIILFNDQGEIVASASRTRLHPNPRDYSWATFKEYFISAPQEKSYYGPARIDSNGEPFMVLATPLINFQTGAFNGIMACRLRTARIWEAIVAKPIGQRGILYITDQNGNIIVHPNPSTLLKGLQADISSTRHLQRRPNGERFLRVVEKVSIANQDFAVVIERPAAEAFSLTFELLIFMGVFLLLFLAGGIALGWIFSRKIIGPITSLAQTAEQIRSGDLTAKSPISRDDELGLLAKSFNAMTSQLAAEIAELEKTKDALHESQEKLEHKVDERTADLESLLTCSKILTSTRDLQSLYHQAVSLAQSLFDLDYSTIMLLTADKKALVIEDTIGFPASTIGTFALVGGQGLSTYVVKEKKPATVVNFATESRFEIPPLVFTKNITSALCVPMMIGDDVFGVFIGHTHEERTFSADQLSLCQSFANQVAVAIDNAIHLKNLHDSELKFKELFDHVNDAILVYSMDGTILEANNVACQRLGYSRDELLHCPPDKFIAPQFAAKLQGRIKAVSEGKKDIFETAHITRSGQEIPIELSCTVFEYEGQPAILAIARDIEERKKITEEIIKHRKLESIGVLAGGIAHDFNNILAAIIGNINLAAMQLNPADSCHELLLSAEKAALRARDLTLQLLTFSKGGEPIKELASISEVISDSANFILRGTSIKCTYSFADNLWPVEIDAGQISQVIQNIVINACEVMPEGGSIKISCDNIGAEDCHNLPVKTGDYVKIAIKDDGPGIPAQQLREIFDPYFTLKEHGSGLGLAITHSIITKHGGVITAESPKDGGALFTIYLLAARQADLATEQEPELPSTSGPGKLMVMDDDEMIRKISDKLLSNLGYKVILAADGHEAIDLYKRTMNSNDSIDGIIMDLTIPGGMGGKEAVQEILRIDPGAKVIVSSGYSNDPIMANYQQYGFCAAIAKPYQLKNLMKVLAQVLSEAEQPTPPVIASPHI